MGIKSIFVKPFASYTARSIRKWSANAVGAQEAILKKLIETGRQTAFGKDHFFDRFDSYEAFRQQVPARDYEGLKSYMDRVVEGEENVLWPGLPRYFAKTSGTTSGVKYIPITKDSVSNHFGTARNAVFNYIAQTGKSQFLDGKLIFLSGSPELFEKNGILTGRLSGISNHLVPSWLKGNQLPSYDTNCIEDWETKLDKIVEETIDQNMTMISGIPPWVQMYYERLLEVSGKKNIKEIFPNFSLFVYGGVNFEPYRSKLEELVGERVDSVETYPASEGFIAFQDIPGDPGLLLNADSGIFFEFIPVAEFGKPDAKRVYLKDVEIGVNYVLILSSNAGLWGYNIGDTVRFISKDPPRLLVTGRVKHFISAFGEHVIGKEVEEALLSVCKKENISIVEFTVAPQIHPKAGLPYHEWLVEFDSTPKNIEALEKMVDAKMVEQNIYYKDLIDGNMLRTLRITPVRRDSFRDYMKSQGKLGGQNKVPRLSNDREIADKILALQ